MLHVRVLFLFCKFDPLIFFFAVLVVVAVYHYTILFFVRVN